MEHLIEPARNRHDHREHRDGVEKGGKRHREDKDHQRQQQMRPHTEQHARERKQQEILQEVDPGEHEDQQQQHRQCTRDLVIGRRGAGESQQHCFEGDETAGLQGMALQGHRERENELQEDQPADDHRTVEPTELEHQRIQDEERRDRDLVPARRLAEESANEGLAERGSHAVQTLDTVGLIHLYPSDRTRASSPPLRSGGGLGWGHAEECCCN